MHVSNVLCAFVVNCVCVCLVNIALWFAKFALSLDNCALLCQVCAVLVCVALSFVNFACPLIRGRKSEVFSAKVPARWSVVSEVFCLFFCLFSHGGRMSSVGGQQLEGL